MASATWNGEVIAESDDTVVVEGNHYFPLSSVKEGALTANESTSSCPWKGTASYFNVNAGGESNVDAAFEYRTPKAEAAVIVDRVAFWKGVTVTE